MDAAAELSSSPPTTVMIVENQTVIRQLLAQYLAALPGFAVVAEAATAEEALGLLPSCNPDIVVLDWLLPGRSAGKFLQEGLGGVNSPRVLVFSGNSSDVAVREAFTQGAKGFLEKTASFADFTEALRAMAAGKVYMSQAVMRAVHRMSASRESPELATELSARELEVLRCVAEGMTSKAIAAKLGISVRTVGNHRARIGRRTGFNTIAQLTLHAARLGLLTEVSLPAANDPVVAR